MLDASYEVTGISSPLGDFFLAKFPQGSPKYWGQLNTQQDLNLKVLEKISISILRKFRPQTVTKENFSVACRQKVFHRKPDQHLESYTIT